ncbi:MAG: 1-acylglycerol-3-phosphate O-acyltransferase [Heterodermia speciosa]|uniref:1-acyl-sn-glycerol-3-phosphate acyltransferase n=1 Tax=Heterodermia speciosa TaxID=116794 RepID=A0A8H3IUI4_9LECA|nr:MAG: 1-acylglycerol-3-phosphate O-acyltransferase [Heterodermia speciosa]
MNSLYYILLNLSVTYLGLTLALFSLSGASILLPYTSFIARLLASYLCLILCAAYGAVVSIFLRLVGKHRLAQHLTARAFQLCMRLSTGVEFDVVSGREYLSTRPSVIIGNHQSELDVLLLGAIFPPYCSVTAKSSLKLVPVLGWYMALSGTVFIDRSNRTDALKAFDGAAEEIRREKQNVFIFPEGTRSYAKAPTLGAFKKGAFHLAVKAQVDVVPVVAGCYWGVLGPGERRFRAGRIPVKVLPPISTRGLTPADVDELTRTTREKMLAELIALTDTPMGQKAAKAEVVLPGEEDLALLATKTQ